MKEHLLEHFMNSSEMLEQIYRDNHVPQDQKDIVQFWGRTCYEAKKSSALYSASRPMNEINTYMDVERWNRMREEIKNNTHAIFNHGDNREENSIVFLMTGIVTNKTLDVAVLMRRDSDNIFCAGILADRTDPLAFWGFPSIRIQKDKLGYTLHGWALAGALEVPDQANAKSMVNTYLSALCYLDDQLETDRKTGKYGDGVKHHTILDPAMIFSGAPAWLTEETAA